DAGEQALGARAVAGGARGGTRHRDEVLGARQDERVLGVVVAWDALRGLTADPRNAKTPAEPERPVASAGAVAEAELWLETVATGRQPDRDGEIPGPGVQIGRELLADAVERATSLGKGGQLIRLGCAVAHRSTTRRSASAGQLLRLGASQSG